MEGEGPTLTVHDYYDSGIGMVKDYQCAQANDVRNFKIIFIFLVKPFFYMPKKSIQKFEYLENEKSF